MGSVIKRAKVKVAVHVGAVYNRYEWKSRKNQLIWVKSTKIKVKIA
jgi:hypothetical protein